MKMHGSNKKTSRFLRLEGAGRFYVVQRPCYQFFQAASIFIIAQHLVSGLDILPAGGMLVVVMAGGIVDLQHLFLFHIGIGLRNGGKQCPGVGMGRMPEERLRVGHFHNQALVYHGNAIADEAHHGQGRG